MIGKLRNGKTGDVLYATARKFNDDGEAVYVLKTENPANIDSVGANLSAMAGSIPARLVDDAVESDNDWSWIEGGGA